MKYCTLFFLILSISSIATADNKSDSGTECMESVVDTNFGVVASIGEYGTGDLSIDANLSDATPGGDASKITASIKKLGNNKCESVVSNTSKCIQYSLSVAVNEAKRGAKKPVTKTTSTLKLKPGEKSTFAFSCSPEANYQIEILKAKGSIVK